MSNVESWGGMVAQWIEIEVIENLEIPVYSKSSQISSI